MRDVWTVWKKELRESLPIPGKGRMWLGPAILVLLFGVVLPLSDPDLAPRLPYLIALLPLFLVAHDVADSFAGEWERKTLETLLATRIPDAALFLGKILAAVTHGWLLTLLTAACMSVTVLVSGAEMRIAPSALLCLLVGSVLLGFLVAGIGVFLSLRLKSVRATGQLLTLPAIVLFICAGFLKRWVLALPPETRRWLGEILATLSPAAWLLVVFVLAALVDAAVLWFGVARFKRASLLEG